MGYLHYKKHYRHSQYPDQGLFILRTIIFGDIHGCVHEWQDLMKKASVSREDRLVTIGDLVCKGPFPKETLDLALSLPNLQCILGNYEWYLLKIWEGKTCPWPGKIHARTTYEELGRDADKYMTFISTWPLYLETPEYLAVHAGIKPGIPLDRQQPEDLLHLRTLEPDGSPWYESYTEEKLIIHGHWARQGLNVRANVIGLDSGCVYGRKLSALILPERKIVTAPARKVYQPIRHPH